MPDLPELFDIVHTGERIQINRLPLRPQRKTHQYEVIRSSTGMILGFISFNVGWQQFVFVPYSASVWSESCLRDVQKFLKSLKKEDASHGMA